MQTLCLYLRAANLWQQRVSREFLSALEFHQNCVYIFALKEDDLLQNLPPKSERENA